MRATVLAAGVLLFSSVLGWAQDYPVAFPTLAGGTIGIGELAQGRWAVGFVVAPGCPACEKVVPWFAYAAQAFPEIRFLLVAPNATPELAGLAGGLQVYVDRGGAFGAGLGVRRAPTVILLVEGAVAGRLDWPFTEEELARALASSRAVHVPTPRDLLGSPPPDGSGVDLAGNPVHLSDLPRPLLLVFFNLCVIRIAVGG